MKATMPELKKKVNSLTRVELTGTNLSVNNPYWINSEHIGFMRRAVTDIIEAGNGMPTKRFEVTEVQQKKLNGWIDGLAQKYLNGVR